MDTLKKRILIADDDAGIVDSLSLLLEVLGFDVASTMEGGKVVDAIKNKPDLLLLDIWMSGVDGRDICRLIKANVATHLGQQPLLGCQRALGHHRQQPHRGGIASDARQQSTDGQVLGALRHRLANGRR